MSPPHSHFLISTYIQKTIISIMSYKELQEASLGLLAEEDHRGSSADTEAFHRLPQYSPPTRGKPLAYCICYCSLVLNIFLFASTVWLHHKNTALASPLPPWPSTVYCERYFLTDST